MSKAFSALLPFTAQLLEELAQEDYAGEQLASMKTIPDTTAIALAAREEQRGRPLHASTILDCLQGHPQLVAIAQYDRQLALELKALLDLCEDADFEKARGVAMSISRLLHVQYVGTRADESGVAR